MIRLDLTHPDPWTNIAIDEAILETAESEVSQGHPHPQIFRLWEPPEAAVILGRSSPYSVEVDHEFCRKNEIPVIRRCSGGQSGRHWPRLLDVCGTA